MTLYPKLIMDALATVVYPGTKKNLVESGMVADQPAIDGMKVKVISIPEEYGKGCRGCHTLSYIEGRRGGDRHRVQVGSTS